MGQKGLALNIAVIGVVIIVVVIGGLYLVKSQQGKNTSQQQIQIEGDPEVVLKDNPADKNKNDVFLKDKNGRETFFITLEDVLKHNLHYFEYHNGNLYIIRRTGGEEDYKDIPDWTDELWKYGPDKRGKKLYGSRGLDFRVSDDDKLIAIDGSDEEQKQLLVFVDTDGNELESFDTAGLEVDRFDLLVWGKSSFWLVEKAMPVPASFIKIDISSYQGTKYGVVGDRIGVEYVLNPDTQKLAYSNFPPLFDTDGEKEFKQSGKKVILYVYDLVTDEKKEIDTSITKEFNPKWVDDETIEYDNPNGEGRMTKKI